MKAKLISPDERRRAKRLISQLEEGAEVINKARLRIIRGTADENEVNHLEAHQYVYEHNARELIRVVFGDKVELTYREE